MQFIRVSEMLATMEMKGEDNLSVPFEFRFVTCNVKKKTGGKRITCENVVLVGGAVAKTDIRNQDHFKNYTRNFKSINNQEIRQFHPLLVEEFNKMRVTA